MFFSLHQKQKLPQIIGGFSLVELMVTIAIITLVTGLVMVRYSSFNSSVILQSQAYEMALDIREAQVLGVSVGGDSGKFRKAYGIYINLNPSSRNTYLLFQDAPTAGNDYKYDAGEEVGEVYTIDSRFFISKICTGSGATETCDATDTAYASIAFKRPDFDARISTNTVTNPSQISIDIALVKDPTVFRRVVVYPSGQISVK